MKRIFGERARLVVYVEAGDLGRMVVRAKSEGKTLVEWARETLVGASGAGKGVRRAEPVRVAEGRAGASGGDCKCGHPRIQHSETAGCFAKGCECRKYKED